MIPATMIRAVRELERRRAYGERHVRRLLNADDWRWRTHLAASTRTKWVAKHGAGVPMPIGALFKILWGDRGLYNRSPIIDLVPSYSILQQYKPEGALAINWVETPSTEGMFVMPLRTTP